MADERSKGKGIRTVSKRERNREAMILIRGKKKREEGRDAVESTKGERRRGRTPEDKDIKKRIGGCSTEEQRQRRRRQQTRTTRLGKTQRDSAYKEEIPQNAQNSIK
eukprot:TRINITY_DN10617_c0_g1_i5.p1 TRINITY_DN10617_c0_g1~~TRINITY_DN10617_c0_g1_i5.p1  ORF type:complete len:107 (+),score=15.16 TRINITY_DN10617_c0_g1_i5:572-892(+)